jgi:hypothetical protein
MMQRTRSILLSATALVLFVTAGARQAHAAQDFSVTAGSPLATVTPGDPSNQAGIWQWNVPLNPLVFPATASLSAGQSFQFAPAALGLGLVNASQPSINTIPFGTSPDGSYTHAATLSLHFNSPAAAGSITVDGTVTETLSSGTATLSLDNAQHFRFVDVITASFPSKTVTLADGTTFQIDVTSSGSQTISAWNMSILGGLQVVYLIQESGPGVGLDVKVTLVHERTSDCSPGFYGPQCQACPDCGPNGTCNDGQNGNGTCLCDLFYSGTPCQPDLTACVNAYNSCQSASGNCPANLTACQASATQCQGDLGTCQSASSNLQSSLTTCQGDLGTCQSTSSNLQSSLTTCQTTSTQLQTNLTACQSDDATCQGNLGTCAAQSSTLQSNLATCNAANATCTAQLSDANSANLVCQANLSTAKTALASAQSALSQCSAQNTQLQSQVTGLQSQLNTCQANGGADHTSLLALQAQVATDTNAVRDFFRLTFHDPAFVIPGATPADQLDSLVAALGSLPPGQVNQLYRKLSGPH